MSISSQAEAPSERGEDCERSPLYPSRDKLNLAFAAVRRAAVPQIPDVVLALRQELMREEPDMGVAADLIAQDVALSGQLLKTVNSPLFGSRHPVASVQQAVSMLGLRRLATLVTAAALTHLFTDANDAARVIWESIMEQTRAAVAIALKLGDPHPEEAYLFGLMHDVGCLIFADLLPEYGSVWVLQAASPSALLGHEQRALGVDHTTVGFLLASTWKLPEQMTLALYHHHDRSFNHLEDGRARSFIATTQLAHYLIALGQGNQEMPEMMSYLDSARLELEINDEVFASLCEEASSGHWSSDGIA
ncbi:MAG: HDOD domain-containing protein [Chromatiaceae bacterium]|nr:HDOD domain-containing protein [Chromatiaceae bacterium]